MELQNIKMQEAGQLLVACKLCEYGIHIIQFQTIINNNKNVAV